MIKVILRKGLSSELPISLSDGELGFCIDTYQLYIGNQGANKLIGNGILSRKVSGIALNNTIDTLEVGEYYSVMATVLPFDVAYDNEVIWESSDPTICTVQYGVVNAIGVGTTTITAYDSTKNFSASFQISVTQTAPESYTPEQIYNVVATDYSIALDNTNSTNTTNGIINALNYASTNGYKKIIFPNGTYLINPTVGTINLPSDMVIDFSNSVINIEPSSLTATGYTMIKMDNVQYTKLQNVKVYGEADSTTLSASVENCVSLMITDCYKSGIENCTFSKSPGFNITATTKRIKDGTSDATYIHYTNFETGNIDSSGNLDNTVTTFHYRTNIFIDLSNIGTYFMFGYNQGYSGYPYLRSRLYSIFFYDVNYQFITAQYYNRQFYNYDKPANAKYAKLVIYQDSAPNSQDVDFKAVAFIRTLGSPRRCFIKNSILSNNFSTGLAMTGGQHWTISGNTFSGNNGRTPGCDIDWEDGWDSMVGDIVVNNTFNSTLGIDVSDSQNISIINNTFNNSYVVIWSRAQNWRILNNTFNGKAGNAGQFDCSFSTEGDSYLANNTFIGMRYGKSTADTQVAYAIHDINNSLS